MKNRFCDRTKRLQEYSSPEKAKFACASDNDCICIGSEKFSGGVWYTYGVSMLNAQLGGLFYHEGTESWRKGNFIHCLQD